jgi:fructokinase
VVSKAEEPGQAAAAALEPRPDGRRLGVLCLGEALVDLLPDRRGALRDCDAFAVHSGGAPANVAVGLARLGCRTAFAGVLGDDEFGRLLERRLRAEGIDCTLRFTREAPTGLWFVALDQSGNRSFFTPTGAASADKKIEVQDVLRAPIHEAAWLHTGSSCHILPAAQEALLAALTRAREAGTRTSCDPNVRAHLWKDPAELVALCARAFPLCDVVKLSDEEAELLLGEREPRAQLARLVEEFGVGLACITLGQDSTGAGDGFVAALLSRLSAPHAPRLEEWSGPRLHEALRFACAVGSRVCTRPGATAALPTKEEAEGL